MNNISELKSIYWDKWEEVKALRHEFKSSFKLLKQLTDLADETVSNIANLSGFSGDDLVLIALGGYARREMAPYSDIDLLILHKYDLNKNQESFLKNFSTTMWDMGLQPGIQIKALGEIEQSAFEDEIVKTSFMDNRFIMGDSKLFEEFRHILNSKVIGRGKKEFLILKISEVRRRSWKFRDSIYRLEPNIKEGRGGIRDLNTIYWITKTLFGNPDIDNLIKQHIVTEKDYLALRSGAEFILRIRCELQYFHSRKYDVLNLEAQQEIAKRLGYTSTSNVMAVEKFLKDYYLAARNISEITEKVMGATIAKITDKNKNGVNSAVSLGYGFYKYNRYLSVSDKDIFKKNPFKLLKIFSIASSKGLKFSDLTLQLIEENLYLIDENYIKKYGRYFLKLISNFPDSAKTVKKLIHAGVFFRFIPEFEQIVCKAQFDMYHHYTVDEHTIIALQFIDNLSQALPVRYRKYQEVYRSLKRHELLGLAIILHDIGKGQGKNHSEIGARMAVNICRRIGLNLDETDTIVALVRHHLLMSHISQRRDLHDIDIINHFISYFDDPEDIKLLYLLTYADTNAVGGQVFNEWKNMLLTELYEKAIGALSAENLTREFKKIVERKRIKITERYDDKDFVAYALESMDDEYVYSNKLKHIYRHLGMIQKLSAVNNVIIFSEKRDDLKCVEFTICTYDFIGLLRKLAGVFSLYEFNILGAQINTFSNNIAIDTIQVSNEKEHTDFIDEKSAEVEKTIKKAIDHQLDIESLLEIKSKRNFFTRQRSVTPVPSKIEFDNDISSTYTVVDVYTEDKLGLLYNLLSVFEKLNISVVKAKISTDVDRVVDSFYIMDENNKKITDTKEINKIKKELEKVI
jgi:[protein-PII] uridylyltransferase